MNRASSEESFTFSCAIVSMFGFAITMGTFFVLITMLALWVKVQPQRPTFITIVVTSTAQAPLVNAPLQVVAAAPTNTPVPSSTPAPLATFTNTPIPTDTPLPTNTPLPPDTPLPIDTPTALPTFTLTPTDAPVSIAGPSHTIGQDVLVDEVRWKILSAENLGDKIISTNQFIKDKTTSGMFIKIRFEVENRSKDMLSFAGLDLVDDKGRKYTRSSDSFSGVDSEETCFIENLNPNITKTCTHIFEVPKDASGLKVDAGDLKIFGSSETLISLGM